MRFHRCPSLTTIFAEITSQEDICWPQHISRTLFDGLPLSCRILFCRGQKVVIISNTCLLWAAQAMKSSVGVRLIETGGRKKWSEWHLGRVMPVYLFLSVYITVDNEEHVDPFSTGGVLSDSWLLTLLKLQWNTLACKPFFHAQQTCADPHFYLSCFFTSDTRTI